MGYRAAFPVDGSSTLTVLQWEGTCPTREAKVYPDDQGRLSSLLDWLLERAGGGGATVEEDPLATQLLATFIVALGDWNRRPSPEDAPIAALIAEMRRSLHLAIGLEYCCRHTGLGSSQLTRRFKAVTGRTPLRYLQDLRLERAHHLLCTTKRDMSAIARRVGYRDPGHL